MKGPGEFVERLLARCVNMNYPNVKGECENVPYQVRFARMQFYFYKCKNEIYDNYKKGNMIFISFSSYSKFISSANTIINFRPIKDVLYEYPSINIEKFRIPINKDIEDQDYFTVITEIKNPNKIIPYTFSLNQSQNLMSHDELFRFLDFKPLHQYCFGCKSHFDYELNRCSKCKATHYCSRKCQLNHWNEHKKYCSLDYLTKKYIYKCISCNNFFENELKKCGKCKKIEYCSKECLINHWPRHKKYCHDINDDVIVDD